MVIGITISAFSQTSYPKKILWEGDTVVAINKEQLIKINRSLNDYIHVRKINKYLHMDIAVSDSLTYYWKNIALKTDSIAIMESKKFDEVNTININLQNALREEKTKSKKIGIGVGVGGTMLGILLGVLFIN